MTHQTKMTTYLQSFIEGLVDSGVRYAVISPGSRSTPLSLLLYREERIETFIDVDERSAGFFALGLCKGSKSPVVLVCTSGTAAANYFPAICEAKESHLPLVVLTTDRPHELRQVGAAQTIDQLHLYHEQVKYFTEMALPEDTPEMLQYSFWQGRRLPDIATTVPSAPVHANFPLREPLLPSQTKNMANHKSVSVLKGSLMLSSKQTEEWVNELVGKQGVIVVGGSFSQDEAKGFIKLAEQFNWPLIGDPLTNIMSSGVQSECLMSHADLFIGESGRNLRPEVVLRFGSLPVSKQVMSWLSHLAPHETTVYVIDETGEWQDSLKQGHVMIQAQPMKILESVTDIPVVPTAVLWRDKWVALQELATKVITSSESFNVLTESSASRMVHQHMMASGHLFVSNSMSIRYLDRFIEPSKVAYETLGNRGVNGIDGIISTALGVTAVSPSDQHILLVGDLTLFHDMNGLMMAKRYGLPLTIVLLNNNGGGIFSFLSQQQLDKEEFEPLFGTPIDLDFSTVAMLYGAVYQKVATLSELENLLVQTKETRCFNLIEVVGNRDDNVLLLEEIQGAIRKGCS